MYDVVLLIERGLSELDARQVVGLHEGLDEPVAYHVLLPVDDASSHVHAALGSIARYEMIPPTQALSDEALARLDAELVEEAKAMLRRSLARLHATGRAAVGELTHGNPVRGLCRVAGDTGAREAIVLTGPHAIREFLHVDWASKARRSLGIPCLHLIEHEELVDGG